MFRMLAGLFFILFIFFMISNIRSGFGGKKREDKKRKIAETKRIFLTNKISSLLEIADTLKRELMFNEKNNTSLFLNLNEIIRKLKENIDLLNTNREDCWYILNDEQNIEELEKKLMKIQQDVLKLN